MKNIFYFVITCLIWGSTWLVITFQLGKVDPILSVAYRFFLSAILLFVYIYFTGKNLRYSLKEHFFMLQLGVFLFGLNYLLTYNAELYIASGLVAIAFSTIVFFNILNNAIFLRSKIKMDVLFSAIMGFIGILLVFKNEIFNFSFESNNSKGFALAMVGAFIASLGNITSARNQKKNMPVMQANAFGMFYGSILMFVIAIFNGTPIIFDFSFSYITSLLYLSVFGSIIAFSTYLTLLGNIGADRAAYVTLVFPIIALMLSSYFEGYVWSSYAILGLFLISIGNIFVLKKRN